MELSTIVFLLLAIIGWGMGAFFDKMTLKYVDPSGAFYLRALCMIVMFTPLLLWKYAPAKGALVNSDKFASIFVFSSVVATMGGVFFYLKALSGGEASKIVPLSCVYPFVTSLMAWAFLGEGFTLNKLIGTALLTGGVYFISK